MFWAGVLCVRNFSLCRIGVFAKQQIEAASEERILRIVARGPARWHDGAKLAVLDEFRVISGPSFVSGMLWYLIIIFLE